MSFIDLEDGQVKYTGKQMALQAVRNAHYPCGKSGARFGIITQAFGVGSTVAKELCRLAGLDPYEELEGPQCQACEQAESDAERETGYGSPWD